MSDQDRYGNYMAQQPQSTHRNTNGNYDGSGNSQSFPDYPQPSGGYAGQRQMMFGPYLESAEQSQHGEDQYRGYNEYGGQEYYAGSGEKLRPLPPRRRSKGWLWPVLILTTLVVMMMGFVLGAHNVSDYRFGPDMKPGHMMGMRFGKGDTPQQSFQLVSGMIPTLTINDTNGSVSIHSGGDSNVITVSVASHNGDRSQNVPATFDKQKDILSIDTSGVDSGADIVVTTPANVNVNVQDGTGDIQLQGINGQVNVQGTDGTIELSQDSLSGQSSIKTQNGSINFQGSLSQQGNYDFESADGSVNLQLPSNASFQLVSSSGNLHNEFNSSSVGSSPHPLLNVSSINGEINISHGQ